MYTDKVIYEYIELTKELEDYIYKNLNEREYKELLFKGHIKLAMKIANTFNIPNYTRDEIESEAFIGLWKAVLEFAPERGFKFSTFATRCIQNHLLTILNSKKNDLSFLSLDVCISEDSDDDTMLYNILGGSYKDYIHDDTRIMLREAIKNSLTKEEITLVYLHYYKDMSTRKIADIYNTHKAVISKKLGKIRSKLVLYIVTGKVFKNVTDKAAFEVINKLGKNERGELFYE